MGISNRSLLASYDYYTYADPDYAIHLGKIHSQSLHYWGHSYTRAPRSYGKDGNSFYWWFYKANHKDPPTSEKIVSMIRCAGGKDQIWESN